LAEAAVPVVHCGFAILVAVSGKNLELVTTAFRAAIARPKPDFATMNELFAPDHVLVPAFAGMGGEEYLGKDWYKAFIPERPSEPLSWEQTELEGALDVAADRVLTVFSSRFRGAASGVEMAFRVWAVAQIRNGKICRTSFYSDPNAALDAARSS
jgi:ketosteroid isomerase-like protein